MPLIDSKQIRFPLSGSFSGSLSGVAQRAITASYWDGIEQLNSIRSGSITASVGDNSIFLIKSGSTEYVNISPSGTIISNDLIIIKNLTTQTPIIIIENDLIKFVTHSFIPTGSTSAGSIWFTSSSLYVGLE